MKSLWLSAVTEAASLKQRWPLSERSRGNPWPCYMLGSHCALSKNVTVVQKLGFQRWWLWMVTDYRDWFTPEDDRILISTPSSLCIRIMKLLPRFSFQASAQKSRYSQFCRSMNKGPVLVQLKRMKLRNSSDLTSISTVWWGRVEL